MTRAEYTEVVTVIREAARRPEWRHYQPGLARSRPASGSESPAGSAAAWGGVGVGWSSMLAGNATLRSILFCDYFHKFL